MGDRSGRRRYRRRSRSRDRGQMEVISTVLLLGIAVIGTTAILAFGSIQLNEGRQFAQQQRVDHAMTQFDARASLVALGETDSQRAVIDLDSNNAALFVDDDAGWMNVTIVNSSSGAVKQTVVNITMGAVIYELHGTTTAYQGGGVWQRSGGPNGSVMISPPEFHYRTRGGQQPTLTLPLVVVDGEGSPGEEVSITKNGSIISKYPVSGNADRSNPLRDGQINITIQSDYYRAWGRFFETRTGASVDFDHQADTVRIVLVVPTPEGNPNTIESAVSGTGAGEDMDLSGSGSFPAFVDSYNSSKGPYSVSKSHNGTIVYAGNVIVNGNAEVQGDIRSGKAIELSGTAFVNGTGFYTTGFTDSGAATIDGFEQIDGVNSAPSSTERVQDKIDELENNNDNAGASAITASDTLDLSASPLELGAGDYYIKSDTQMTGDKLILNTTNGNITLGVDGDFKLTKGGGDGSNITVVGKNRAEIYVRESVEILKDGIIKVPGQNASRFWLYATGESDIQIEASQGAPADVTGVIFAPRGSDEDGDTTVKHADVFGALVVGQVNIETGGSVHYDRALAGMEAFVDTDQEDVPRITYLHISINRINVSSV